MTGGSCRSTDPILHQNECITYQAAEPLMDLEPFNTEPGGAPMARMKSIIGALSIMMASGVIADFDVLESESEVLVRVWSTDRRDVKHLRKHVAAILPLHVDEEHVTVIATSG
jgi:hypothetical protein